MTVPETPPEKPSRLPRLLAQGLASAILLGLLVPLAGIAALFAPGPLTAPATIVVAHGERTADIGARLAQDGAVYLAVLFRGAAHMVADHSLEAGEYEIPPHASPLAIALMIHEGRSVLRLFTVPEGLTSAEIARLLEKDPALTGAIAVPPPEGSLLPESYRYAYGDSRDGLIERMQKAMREKRAAIWAGRENGLPLKSPEEMVVIASMIEKETGRADERARIAGVFYNRLRLNMRLQSDPTVIYALTNGGGVLARPLTHDDLAVASPVNCANPLPSFTSLRRILSSLS